MTDTTFVFRVNGGPEQTFVAKTGIYVHAVQAIPAVFGIKLPAHVEIWCPSVLPEYGPYNYRLFSNWAGLQIALTDAYHVPEHRRRLYEV